MGRLAALAVAAAGLLGACSSAPAPTTDAGEQARFYLDFGRNLFAADGSASAALGGWTSKFDCAASADGSIRSLHLDDAAHAQNGTGLGVSLDVASVPSGFTVTLGAQGKSFTASVPSDSAQLGFHHVAYFTPSGLLTLDGLSLQSPAGESVRVTGTVSFPNGAACSFQ